MGEVSNMTSKNPGRRVVYAIFPLLIGCAGGAIYNSDAAGFKPVPAEAVRRLLIGATMSPDFGDQQIHISGGRERFEPNGVYARLSDLAPIPGSYKIASNRFCVKPVTTRARECRQLLIDTAGRYATRTVSGAKPGEPVRVTIARTQR